MDDKEIKNLLKKDLGEISSKIEGSEWSSIREKIQGTRLEQPGEWIISLLSGFALLASLLLVFNGAIKEGVGLSDSEIEEIEQFYFDDTYLDEEKDLYIWIE